MTDKTCPSCRRIFYFAVFHPVWHDLVCDKVSNLSLAPEYRRLQKKRKLACFANLQRNAAIHASPPKT